GAAARGAEAGRRRGQAGGHAEGRRGPGIEARAGEAGRQTGRQEKGRGQESREEEGAEEKDCPQESCEEEAREEGCPQGGAPQEQRPPRPARRTAQAHPAHTPPLTDRRPWRARGRAGAGGVASQTLTRGRPKLPPCMASSRCAGALASPSTT